MRRKTVIGFLCLIGLSVTAARFDSALAEPSPLSISFQAETAQDGLTQFIEGMGLWAFVLAPLLMMAVAILPIPAEIPAMINGVLFGPVIGTFVTWSGALVGAVISFELARRYGRPLAQRFINRGMIDRADTLIQSAGWPVLLVLRLIPTVAFTAINWTAGLTALRGWTFLWTTAVGILPGAVVFTVSGTGLAAIYRTSPMAGWAIAIAGLLAIGWTVFRFRQAVGEPQTVPVDG